MPLMRNASVPTSFIQLWARVSRDVVEPLPTADAVDWPLVLERVTGNAAALLVRWGFAELLKRPDRYASLRERS